MTHIESSRTGSANYGTAHRSTGWTGWIVFAAFMMLLNGVIGMIEGLMALVFLEAAPVWGIVVITVDILVIYSLTVHGSEMRDRF